MKLKDKNLPLIKEMIGIVHADPAVIATHKVTDVTQGIHFQKLHTHVKRVLAEQSVFELEPDDPLYGWGILLYQRAFLADEPNGLYFCIEHSDEPQPNTLMKMVRTAVTKGRRFISYAEASEATLRTYLDDARKGKRFLYPVIGMEVANLVVTSDKPRGGTWIKYNSPEQESCQEGIIIRPKNSPETP